MPPHQQAGWEYTRNWEGTQPEYMTTTDQRDIPHHISWGDKKEMGVHSTLWCLSSQITVTCDGAQG